MMQLFHDVSRACSEAVTRRYSTSFSSAIRLLHPDLRGPIHGIYGFVRFADEIVDTFHEYDKATLLREFTEDLRALGPPPPGKKSAKKAAPSKAAAAAAGAAAAATPTGATPGVAGTGQPGR